MNPLELDIWNGWALSKEAAEYVDSELRKKRPKKIAETGSGSSTLLLKHHAPTHSFEHEVKYFHKTRRLLRRYGYDDHIRFCILRQTDKGWQYDVELPDVDFLLIDGPQGYYGRGGVLYQFAPHLNEGAVVLLDDANRDKEKEILRQWEKDFNIKPEINGRVAKIVWK